MKAISLPIMASDSEPVKKVLHESSSDDAVLEQLGYTQGMVIQFSIKSFFFTSNIGLNLLTTCRTQAQFRSHRNGRIFL